MSNLPLSTFNTDCYKEPLVGWVEKNHSCRSTCSSLKILQSMVSIWAIFRRIKRVLNKIKKKKDNYLFYLSNHNCMNCKTKTRGPRSLRLARGSMYVLLYVQYKNTHKALKRKYAFVFWCLPMYKRIWYEQQTFRLQASIQRPGLNIPQYLWYINYTPKNWPIMAYQLCINKSLTLPDFKTILP